MAYNGPVIWGVAVCVGVGMRFCFERRSFNEGGQSPGKWTGSPCHD